MGMKKLSAVKISHKISSLMLGLIVGFILMGVAYYAQISADIKQKSLDQQYAQTISVLENVKEKQQAISNLAIDQLTRSPNQPLVDPEEVERALNESIDQLAKMDYHFFSPSAQELVSTTAESYAVSLQSLLASHANAQRASLEDALQNVPAMKMRINEASAPLEESLDSYQSAIEQNYQRRTDATSSEKSIAQWMFAIVLILTAILTTLGLFLIYRSIVLPLMHMQSIIAQQNRGNDKARVNLVANDELGNLGRAFNRLLDERIQVLSDKFQENEELNNSIIALIRALGMIAKKDLSIKVPVSADVTGTVSDAVNLLTSETARTLRQVREVSAKINTISDQLQSQSSVVMTVAEEERTRVAETISALENSAKTMNDVAREARVANTIAAATIDNTIKAQTSVTQTVDSIQVIRSTLSETEKRIKRLGDRSQEITGIVNLINTIAERTHILALNASMHAASAGEAGKGFAVVAEEVQRLAENARGATSEISSMVNNIRVETSDTVAVMNKLIAQVAEGTRLAEDSGQRMQETETATRQLVNHVKSIAVNSVNQANVANRLRERAALITEATQKNQQALEEQHEQTEEMKICASSLMEHVSVFTLPEVKGEAQNNAVVPLRQLPRDDNNLSHTAHA